MVPIINIEIVSNTKIVSKTIGHNSSLGCCWLYFQNCWDLDNYCWGVSLSLINSSFSVKYFFLLPNNQKTAWVYIVHSKAWLMVNFQKQFLIYYCDSACCLIDGELPNIEKFDGSEMDMCIVQKKWLLNHFQQAIVTKWLTKIYENFIKSICIQQQIRSERKVRTTIGAQ